MITEVKKPWQPLTAMQLWGEETTMRCAHCGKDVDPMEATRMANVWRYLLSDVVEKVLCALCLQYALDRFTEHEDGGVEH